MTSDYGELSEGTTATTIACTACGHNTISVGAYVSRPSFINIDGKECGGEWVSGEEYPKSGKGPTFDGRLKPDIMAPGASVISAINSYASAFSVNRNDLVTSRTADGRTDYWGAMSGTSMATPVVTGVIAIWLQANPQLTVSQVQEMLSGMDKIDALKGIQAINSGINDAIIDSNSTVDIYDILGNCLRTNYSTSKLRDLKPGIYLLWNGTEMRKVAIGFNR